MYELRIKDGDGRLKIRWTHWLIAIIRRPTGQPVFVSLSLHLFRCLPNSLSKSVVQTADDKSSNFGTNKPFNGVSRFCPYSNNLQILSIRTKSSNYTRQFPNWHASVAAKRKDKCECQKKKTLNRNTTKERKINLNFKRMEFFLFVYRSAATSQHHCVALKSGRVDFCAVKSREEPFSFHCATTIFGRALIRFAVVVGPSPPPPPSPLIFLSIVIKSILF